MRVLLVNNGTGARIWRLDPYAEWLVKNGHDAILHPNGRDINEIEVRWADVAILEMVLEKKVIEMCHKYKCAVIYEIDDLVEKVTKGHPSYHKLARPITAYRTHN